MLFPDQLREIFVGIRDVLNSIMFDLSLSMPVPDYQTMMLPVLTLFSDGKERQNADIYAGIVEYFNLTEQDKRQMLPGGSQPTFQNRSNWATTYLYQAGLLKRPRRGVYQISNDGLKFLETKPERISVQTLSQIPQFEEWRRRSNKRKSENKIVPVLLSKTSEPEVTPEEAIQSLAQELNDQLASELLEQLHKIDPYQFEQLIVDLMLAMGYGGSKAEAGKVTQSSNDGGIDGVINEDRLGLDTIYLQAKRWEATVGRREIQNFVGALVGRQAHKGVFITTSSFNKNAIEYANTVSQKIILIGGQKLAELMIDFDIGVSTAQTLKLKKIDTDYFEG